MGQFKIVTIFQFNYDFFFFFVFSNHFRYYRRVTDSTPMIPEKWSQWWKPFKVSPWAMDGEYLPPGLPRWLGGKIICLPIQETQEKQVWYLGQKDLLEEEMATHWSILVWKIPRTEEPGGIISTGSQRRTGLSD